MSENLPKKLLLTLETLNKVDRDRTGDAWISAEELRKRTKLTPQDINDAVSILRDRGNVEWQQFLGTAPFKFGLVTITSRGRYELEHTKQEESSFNNSINTNMLNIIQRPPVPVGSPFGFTSLDWEDVAGAKSKSDTLYVVLGLQFKSSHYDTELLKKNVKEMFQEAIEEYNKKPGIVKINLNFKTLSAGYGSHLFNEIARDIISSDVAVFETSDLNPNVMLEMGVALTWDVRVFPIKKIGQQKPPSDISGQTYGDYTDNAEKFVDPDHKDKLIRMVERSAIRKGRS